MANLGIPTKAGVTKLSQLEIDEDKDWQTKAITNIKDLGEALSIGNILVKSKTGEGIEKILKLTPGNKHQLLCSNGPGKVPHWTDDWEGLGLKTGWTRTYTVEINRTYFKEVKMPDHIENREVSLDRDYGSTNGPNEDWFSEKKPEISVSHTETAQTADKSSSNSAEITSEYDTSVA